MFEFIDFILKLWYNSPPESMLKIMAFSGVSSGCLVYYVCKFLEKRKKSMGEEVKDFKLGQWVKIKDVLRDGMRDSVYMTTVGMTGYVKDVLGGKIEVFIPKINDWFSYPKEFIEIVQEQKEVPKSVPNSKEYQKGDKVKILGSSRGGYEAKQKIGSDGEIGRSIDRDGTYQVRFSEEERDYWYYLPEELEFISRPTPVEIPKVVAVEPKKELVVGDRVKVINVVSCSPGVQKTIGAIGEITRIDSNGDHKVLFETPIDDWFYFKKNEIEFVSKETEQLVSIEPKKEEVKEKRIPQVGDTVRVNYSKNPLHHDKTGIFSKVNGFYCYRVTYQNGDFGDTDILDVLEFVSSPETPKVAEELNTLKIQVGDYVKVTSLDFSETPVNRGGIPDKILGKSGAVGYIDSDRIKVNFCKSLGDYWHFPLKCLEISTLEAYNKDNNITPNEKEKTVSDKPKFSKGDEVKIVSHRQGRVDNKCETVDNMIQYMDKVGKISDIDIGLSFVSYRVTFPNKDSWKYSENVLELLPTATLETKGETMEPTKWTLFSTEIPMRRDVVVSNDSKSWRYKTQEETKTETKGETMKTETPKLKANWIPVTHSERPESGEYYYVIDDCQGTYLTEYTEYEDNPVSENFEDCSDVAFYLKESDLHNLITIPSEDEIKKVLEEQDTKEEMKTLTMTDLAKNFSSYSKEKQAEVVAFLQSKGIKAQV